MKRTTKKANQTVRRVRMTVRTGVKGGTKVYIEGVDMLDDGAQSPDPNQR